MNADDVVSINTTNFGVNITAGSGDINLDCITDGAINLTAGGNNSGTNVITLDAPYGNIELTSGSDIGLTATNNLIVTAGNGLQFATSTIKYASKYSTSDVTLSIADSYAQTYDGSTLTATLPVVDVNNVGIQFLITNTNATALTVNSSSSQTIYSTIAGLSATSRTLNTEHSQIFTAIKTTSASTYGWSMV